jgi:hypothetical protein
VKPAALTLLKALLLQQARLEQQQQQQQILWMHCSSCWTSELCIELLVT